MTAIFKFKDDRACKGNLGVSLSELDRLTELFAKNYEAHLLVGRENRQRKVGGGKKGITPTAYDKVCYCLFYLKTYPTFDVLATRYGTTAGSANRLLHKLLPVFYTTFKESGLQPIAEFKTPEELQVYFAKKNRDGLH